MLHRVRLAPTVPASYSGVAPEEQLCQLEVLSKQLQGLRVAHINATPYGGGVSELLRSAVALECGLGLAVDWLVISGDTRFFEVTKALHNGLQGKSFAATVDMEETYILNNRANAAAFPVESYDVVVVHDPQPAALRAFARDGRARWVWRCHIDTSEPDPAAEAFLLPWLDGYDRFVFTMEEFVLPSVRNRHIVVFTPGIDPLSPKNLPLSPLLRRRIASWYGADVARPLLLQVSRFDPWKDPFGVIRVYRRVREVVPEVQLALLGSMALDDPEGWRLYEELRVEAERDGGIILGTNLTGVSFVEVNAFQHCAWVVVQKSIREGFGLVVSEALWKETPVVAGRSGGITLQMGEGEGGYLIEPGDEETFVERIIYLLQNREVAWQLGRRGRERVRQQFLITRYVRDELSLFAQLLQEATVIEPRGMVEE